MRQALGIARELEGEPVDAIVSSPYLRCRQTVQPIGSARDLRVEIDPALAKGEGGSKAVEMLCAMDAERFFPRLGTKASHDPNNPRISGRFLVNTPLIAVSIKWL